MKTAKNDYSVGFTLMEEGKYPEAAHFFLDIWKYDPIDGTAILNCGACLWFGLKNYFFLLKKMCFSACRSGAFDELFITYLLNPSDYKYSLFVQQLRKVVLNHEINRLRNCLDAAEFCFNKAYELGKKGVALIWLVTLTRGTGQYHKCRQLVLKASEEPDISTKDMAEAKERADNIPRWEADLDQIARMSGGWVIPNTTFLFPRTIDQLIPIVEDINKLFKNTTTPSDAKKVSWWKFLKNRP